MLDPNLQSPAPVHCRLQIAESRITQGLAVSDSSIKHHPTALSKVSPTRDHRASSKVSSSSPPFPPLPDRLRRLAPLRASPRPCYPSPRRPLRPVLFLVFL